MHPSTLYDCCNLYLDNCQYEGFKTRNELIYNLSCKHLTSELTSNERLILENFFDNNDISYQP